MLSLSFGLCLIAALLGGVLAVPHLRSDRTTPPALSLGFLHGIVGTTGLVMLLLVLRGPPRGEALGVGSFGCIAAGLLALALLAGLAIVIARMRSRRVPGVAIGIHAAAAVSGVVVLAAYTLMG